MRDAEQLDTVRIYESPYESVDWSNDLRLTAQHHDHVGARLDKILAYDAAGYNVLSLMDYSGNADLPYALRQRIWPAEQWVSPSLLTTLKNIKIFLPNAEEVGIGISPPSDPAKHATSPFLVTYIEGAQRATAAVSESALPPNQYRSLEQLFALIRSLGGFPCLAHPWDFSYRRLDLGSSYCVEIYSAHAEVLRERGVPFYRDKDRNEYTVGTWDDVLQRNQRIFGIAVNDHFGPYVPNGVISDRVRDSGKILVLAKTATLDAYHESFVSGSFFAVRDYGGVKNRYPVIHSIDVEETYIYIETTDTVKWIAEGVVVGQSPILFYRSLPVGARYVRAEVSGADDSTVYTQAFVVRPVADVDGDYDIDKDDSEICRGIFAGVDGEVVQRRACADVKRRLSAGQILYFSQEP